MKTIRLFALHISFALLLCAACRPSRPVADAALLVPALSVQEPEGAIYQVDTARSFVEWTGSRPGARHHGILKLQQGMLRVSGNLPVYGRFLIDIHSLQPQDMKPTSNAMLRDHLLSEDFFEAARFPLAQFELTGLQPDSIRPGYYLLSGRLQLRDVSQGIRFPARISIKDQQLEADASFSLDRTHWQMHYGNDNSLGDWFIRPEVYIRLKLFASGI